MRTAAEIKAGCLARPASCHIEACSTHGGHLDTSYLEGPCRSHLASCMPNNWVDQSVCRGVSLSIISFSFTLLLEGLSRAMRRTVFMING